MTNSTARVARPTKTGSTPVAMGSRVPPWPIRFSWNTPRSLAHTSWEVHSEGLSMMRTPSAMAHLPDGVQHLVPGLSRLWAGKVAPAAAA